MAGFNPASNPIQNAMYQASAKNLSLTSAASDLGLGDQLQNQVQEQLNEKKRKLQQAASPGGAMDQGGSGLSPAVMMLYGGQK
jgi:hypothetical protein